MGKYYRINQYIQAQQVRVIDEAGKQIDVMPIFNAIQKARELSLDLVEIAPTAQPPVCKIIDFKKFKYLEDKKERGEKKGQKKGGELKEVLFKPFISQNDSSYRIKRVKEFLQEGNKVKIRVKFRGRELGKKVFGFKLIDQITQELAGIATKDADPKFADKEIFAIFSPVKK